MNNNQVLQKDYQVKDSGYFQLERLEMLPYIPQNSSMILEVGCGYGNFGKLLKERCSAQVWGLKLKNMRLLLLFRK